MVYSEKFKSQMVSKMVGPHAMSAGALAAEVGIHQPTLSRWLREVRIVPSMENKSRKTKERGIWLPGRITLRSNELQDETCTFPRILA